MRWKESKGVWLLVGGLMATGSFLIWDSGFVSKWLDSEKELRILQLNYQQIDQLQIRDRKDLLDIKLVRSVDGWSLVEPVEDLADNEVVDQFIRDLYPEQRFETLKSQPLANYRLDNQPAFVQVTDSLGRSQKFFVSLLRNIENLSFIKIEDEDSVILTSSQWANRIQLDTDYFRDRRLVRLAKGKAQSIQVLNRGKNLWQLLKTAQVWSFNNETSEQLNQFIDRVFRFRIEHILLPQEDIKVSIKDLEYDLRIATLDGSITLKFYKTGSGTYYIESSLGQRMTAPEASLAWLFDLDQLKSPPKKEEGKK